MIDQDPLMERLRDLPMMPPPPNLSQNIQALAHAKLRAQPVHPVWTLAVAAWVVTYLGWAFVFASNLY